MHIALYARSRGGAIPTGVVPHRRRRSAASYRLGIRRGPRARRAVIRARDRLRRRWWSCWRLAGAFRRAGRDDRARRVDRGARCHREGDRAGGDDHRDCSLVDVDRFSIVVEQRLRVTRGRSRDVDSYLHFVESRNRPLRHEPEEDARHDELAVVPATALCVVGAMAHVPRLRIGDDRPRRPVAFALDGWPFCMMRGARLRGSLIVLLIAYEAIRYRESRSFYPARRVPTAEQLLKV